MLKIAAGQALAETRNSTQNSHLSSGQAARHERVNASARTLRGGRITKFKGQVASMSPSISDLMMSVSSMALLHGLFTGLQRGAIATAVAATAATTGLVVTTSGALAQCDSTGPAGTYYCSGDTTTIQALTGTPLDVETDATFTVDTTGSGEDALDLTGTDGLSFKQADGGLDITGDDNGIDAQNTGGGAVTITTTGIVTGLDDDGINADNDEFGTDMTILTKGVVFGDDDGINAENQGTGQLKITTEEAVTGFDDNGIIARNGIEDTDTATNLIIEAKGTVTGGGNGIYANNYGLGYLKITTEMSVSGGADGDPDDEGDGIDAENDGTYMIIRAEGEVVGVEYGIDAENNGSGKMEITTLQTVEGLYADGIFANQNSGTDVIITAYGKVLGYEWGIDANNEGSGKIKITTHAAVVGEEEDGIRAEISEGTDLIIEAKGSVTGGEDGIRANNEGTGYLKITTEKEVFGGVTGIWAETEGEDLIIITNGEVTGLRDGIEAINDGAGKLEITTVMAVEGRSDNGIRAQQDSGTDLIIHAQGDVFGLEDGIDARNEGGTGALTITTRGSVTGDGAGNSAGIRALNESAAGMTINVYGSVFGDNQAINMDGGDAGTTEVNLFDGAGLSSNDGIAIVQDEESTSDTTVNVNAGALVEGQVLLSAGDDMLNFVGASFDNVTIMDGGDGVDLLSFAGTSGALTTANILNWETVEIGAGSTLSALGDQVLDTETLRVLAGGNLSFMDGSANGAFTQAGNFEGEGGMLTFDVDFVNSLADQMIIEGDVAGVTQIGINAVSTATEPGDDILLITVGGTVEETAFALPDGFYESPTLVYELEADIGVDDARFFLATLLDDNGNPILGSTARLYEVGSAALLGAAQLPGLAARFGGRVPVGETSPASTPLGYAESPQLAEILQGESANGVWMRAEGDWQNLEFASTNYATALDSEHFNMRFGGAVERAMAGSRLVFGVQGSILWMNNDADFAFGSGSIDSNGFTLGASATWLHDSGFYADAQVEFGQLSSDFASSSFGSLATDVTTGTTAFSFEVGKAFDLTPNSVLIPQAQLQVGRVSTDDFTDSTSTLVSFGDDTSTIGRLGVLYQYSGTGYALFAGANAIGDFSGEQDVEYGGLDLSVDPEAFWGEVEIGGSYAVNERATLFGAASYRTTLGSDGDNGDGASVSGGFAISF